MDFFQLKNKIVLAAIVVLLQGSTAFAQIPVEFFTGHQKTTADIMFFRYFKTSRGDSGLYRNSRWLFFDRNRAAIDYRMTEQHYLPQFGFTEAISFNHEKLKGFAPVLVGQILSAGLYCKAGIQYVHIQKDITVFSWLVSETKSRPQLDYFLLLRYSPAIGKRIRLFLQAETLNVFPTMQHSAFSFTQRLRMGIRLHQYDFGAGADLSQTGNNHYSQTANAGIFIRHEF